MCIRDRYMGMQMLEEAPGLNSDSKFHKVSMQFHHDQRWKAIDERDRENLFQDFLDDLYERERDRDRQRKREAQDRLQRYLTGRPEFTSATKWDEACLALKDNEAWNSLSQYDQLQFFMQFIVTLEEKDAAEKRKLRWHTERKNREAFRDLLTEHCRKGSLSHKTKWKNFVHLIVEDIRFLAVVGQPGSAPHELFEDFRDSLKENHRRIKETLKQMIRANSDSKTNVQGQAEGQPVEQAAPEVVSMEQFTAMFAAVEAFGKLEDYQKEKYYKYYLAKTRGKERHAAKRQRKALRRLTRYLKSLLPSLTGEAKFEEHEKDLEEKAEELGYSLLSKEEKEARFNQFVQALKDGNLNEVIERERRKKHKKKKKKKGKERTAEDGNGAEDPGPTKRVKLDEVEEEKVGAGDVEQRKDGEKKEEVKAEEDNLSEQGEIKVPPKQKTKSGRDDRQSRSRSRSKKKKHHHKKDSRKHKGSDSRKKDSRRNRSSSRSNS
eukprot:TRINITY_DN12880_c0_g1_i2.p1 TRINITY_DN12880_c0_g1~~TRINITY_DN12880_c0_g1_i2.p1  ORF type:complete len:491 (-),score=154.88 TRINITY_DN12880_c0_g1_i2:124-1596(-)